MNGAFLACAASEGAAALGLKLNRVVFESDSRTLVSALFKKDRELSTIAVLLKEIRCNYISSFESFELLFAPWSCSGAAHSLAQYGLRADSECIGWEGEAPEFVHVLVPSDIAVHLG
jgi:hypothetical protein